MDRIRFHDLRHTFASQLVASGVSLYVVQKLLGHASIRTTERYAHHAPDFLKGLTDGLIFEGPKLDMDNVVHFPLVRTANLRP